jgi:hypothetical protein
MSSSWFSSIFSSGQERPVDPNQVLQKEMASKVKMGVLNQKKRPKAGPGVLGTLSGLITIESTTGGVSSTINTVKDTVIPIASAVKQTVMPSPIPGAETLSQAPNVLVEGASEILSYGRSAASWSWWTFKLLPSGVQVGIGLLGLYLAYRWWNQGGVRGQQDVHVHITINGNSGVPEVKKDGENVSVTLPSTPSPNQPPPPPLPQNKRDASSLWGAVAKGIQDQKFIPVKTAEQRKEEALKRWVSAVKGVQDQMDAAAKLHKTMQKYKDGEMPFPTAYREKIDGLMERFQSMQKEAYAKPDALLLVEDSRAVLKEMRTETRQKQQEIMNVLRKAGG